MDSHLRENLVVSVREMDPWSHRPAQLHPLRLGIPESHSEVSHRVENEITIRCTSVI